VPGKNFRGKPSDAHIIWSRETRKGAKRKRFDTDRFEQWASHCGFEVEREQRVDHDRGAEKRAQYQCVFSWTSTGGESIEFGDEEWELGDQKTPQTFVEIDSKAIARIKDWEEEYIVAIDTMVHKGDRLLIQTEDGEKRQLQSKELATPPEK
jgi:hypothetical protein